MLELFFVRLQNLTDHISSCYAKVVCDHCARAVLSRGINCNSPPDSPPDNLVH